MLWYYADFNVVDRVPILEKTISFLASILAFTMWRSGLNDGLFSQTNYILYIYITLAIP